MTQVALQCENCGADVSPDDLACPNCGALTYRAELERLAAEAQRLEPYNVPAAAMTWQQVLRLLPPESPQYRMIQQRVGALAAGLSPYVPPGEQRPPQPRPLRPPDPLPVAVAKTAGSMVVSILAYYLFSGDFGFAFGIVLLILVHELGHTAAMWYYGLSASPPIFIPFVGALINLRQPPPNALVEAIVGIGGPVTGTLGAVACFAAYWYLPPGAPEGLRFLLLELSVIGALINLFNMLPVPPLDGGRVTAAVSPWIWTLGLAGLVTWIVRNFLLGRQLSTVILVLVLMYALPRVRATLSRRGRDTPYYRIGRTASWTMAALYLLLSAGLALLLFAANHQLPPGARLQL